MTLNAGKGVLYDGFYCTAAVLKNLLTTDEISFLHQKTNKPRRSCLACLLLCLFCYFHFITQHTRVWCGCWCCAALGASYNFYYYTYKVMRQSHLILVFLEFETLILYYFFWYKFGSSRKMDV